MNKLLQPQHVAVIMDGNGRWAQQRNKSRIYGHRHGVESTREVVKLAVEYKIQTLTLYSFSSENWLRPQKEVSALLKLFKETLNNELAELIANGVRLHFIGDIDSLSSDLKSDIKRAEQASAHLTQLKLNIALNYGGRWDIADAVAQLLARSPDHAALDNQAIQQKLAAHFAQHSATDIDLMIRTGGESRISNFLLWQSAYAELYFTDTLWPDFKRSDFTHALDWFAHRQRRFGGTESDD